MIKSNDTLLEHLTVLTLLMYILQSLQGHLNVVQSFISFLNNNGDVTVLIALETNPRLIFNLASKLMEDLDYAKFHYSFIQLKIFI